MRTLCYLLAALLLTSCASIYQNHRDTDDSVQAESVHSSDDKNQVIKSPNDPRLYRTFLLENKLEVLLISDPETDKAAASMDVLVGSSSDPEDFAGLAHFLEHMLFLGTETYPEADAYQKYISDHGGRHNAYTSAEHTNYFFEVSSEHLEGALDRFSQQFTVPLFNEDYVSREVNAVHSEYSSRVKDDGRRYFSALKEVLAEDHPYNKFSVGNLKTLMGKGKEPLRQALLDFYAKHYSANLMKLVVIGKDPLDSLEKTVREKFSAIPNKNIERTPISVDYFDADFLPAKLSVQSVKDTRSLSIAFPIPSPSAYVHSKPSSYLANLIGHEGQGSLLSALKNAQLVDTLSAGVHFDTEVKALFSVTMSLTQQGLENTDAVLEYFFAYVNLIKRAFDQQPDMQKVYFDEMAKMLEIGFRFQEKMSPMNYARALADALHRSEAHEVLVEGYQLDDYNPELYQRFLGFLKPENMLVTLSAKTIESDQTTPWYDAPFIVERLPPKLVSTLSGVSKKPELKLPEANIFIPENVSFIRDEDDAIPTKIYSTEGIELWHAVDNSFGTPKSDLFITIRSPAAMTSATSLNSLEIMVSLLKDALNEFSYAAYLGGLNYELYNHVRGITIKITGYSDKQTLLLDKIIDYLKHKSFSQDRFDIIKESLQRALENKSKQRPYEQAIALAQESMLHPSWSTEERLDSLENISFESIETFRQAFFETLEIAVLNTGNVEQKDALAFTRQLEAALLAQAKRTKVPRSEALQLDPEHTLVDTKTVAHPDTGFIFYVQGKSKDYRERALFSLITQLISSDYYNEIRTEKQLGYIVFATHFPVQDVPGIGFIVQSPVASGIELYEETQQFLSAQASSLQAIDTEKFERAKQSVISKLLKKDNRLYEKSNRYWREIDRENAQFDTREQIISAINALEKEEVVSYLSEIAASPGRKLLAYSINENSEGSIPKGLKLVKDVSQEQRRYF